MTAVHITRNGAYAGEASCRFPYNPDAVEIVRDVPGRHWNAEDKYWTFDNDEVPVAAEMFAAAGHTVFVDGQPWATTSGAAAGSPLTEFYGALPDHLAEPVYKALMRVLHPDVGGDTQLAKQLNAAHDERTGKNQRRRSYG